MITPRGRQKLVREISTRDAMRFGEDKPVRMQVGTVLSVAPEGANIQLQDREIRQVIVHGVVNPDDNVVVFWAGHTAITIGEPPSGGGGGGDFLPLTGGTLTGPLYLPATAPTNPSEATNKAYVDSRVADVVNNHHVVDPTAPTSPPDGALWTNPTTGVTQIWDADNSEWIPVGGATGAYLPLSGGTLTGPLILSGDPTNPLEAVPMQYVDNSISFVYDAASNYTNSQIDIIEANYLPLTGGTMTGPLALAGEPTLPEEAANKSYVDNVASAYLPLSGGTMLGSLLLIGDPTDPFEAATKSYVDDLIAGIPPVFSGDHADLTNVQPDQHHVRYSDAEAIAAVGTPWIDYTTTALLDYLPLAGGTMTGPLELSDDPVNPLEAATKQYVDNLISGGIGGFVPLTGGTMTGILILSESPTAGDDPLQAATWQNISDLYDAFGDFANDVDAGYVHADGDNMTGPLILAADPVAPLEAVTKQYVDDLADVEPFPLGAIMVWPINTAPTGWLLCNGAAVERSTYAALYAAIGDTYGAGDGTTTFNLPNLQGRVPFGVGTLGSDTYALAGIGGEARHTLTGGEVGAHSHTLANHNHALPDHVHPDNHNHDLGTQAAGTQVLGRGAGGTGSGELQVSGSRSIASIGQTQTRTGNTGNPTSNPLSGDPNNNSTSQSPAATAHENRPPYLALHFIILYDPEFKGFGAGAAGSYLPTEGGTMSGPIILNQPQTDPDEAVSKEYVDNALIAVAAAIPPGVIVPYGGASGTVPIGWLYCDGAAVSRTTYEALFLVLGTVYGAGDGSTTFGLPDLRGRFPVGAGGGGPSSRGISGGVWSHTHTGPLHDHTTPNHSHDLGASAGSGTLTTNTQGAHLHTMPSGTNTSNESHSHSFSDSASGSDSFSTGGPSTTGSQQYDPGTTSYALSGHTHSGSVSVSISISGTTSAHSHNHHIGGLDTNTAGNHTHGIATHTHDLGNSTSGGGGTTSDAGTGATGAANPPYQAVNYIVKT